MKINYYHNIECVSVVVFVQWYISKWYSSWYENYWELCARISKQSLVPLTQPALSIFFNHIFLQVMNEFYETCGSGEDLSENSNVPAFSFFTTRDKLLHHFDTFTGCVLGQDGVLFCCQTGWVGRRMMLCKGETDFAFGVIKWGWG